MLRTGAASSGALSSGLPTLALRAAAAMSRNAGELVVFDFVSRNQNLRGDAGAKNQKGCSYKRTTREARIHL